MKLRTPQHLFDHASEALEHALSLWPYVAAYTALLGLCAHLWGWDGLDRAFYISGGYILVLLIGTARRDNKALHAKLDSLTDGDALDRLEERSEREIEEMRK